MLFPKIPNREVGGSGGYELIGGTLSRYVPTLRFLYDRGFGCSSNFPFGWEENRLERKDKQQ